MLLDSKVIHIYLYIFVPPPVLPSDLACSQNDNVSVYQQRKDSSTKNTYNFEHVFQMWHFYKLYLFVTAGLFGNHNSYP